DWPTVVHQGSESPLRRIDVKRRSYSHAEVVPHVPHQPRMYGEIGLSRSALHSRNQFEIVGHAPVSLEGNSKRKPMENLLAMLVVLPPAWVISGSTKPTCPPRVV